MEPEENKDATNETAGQASEPAEGAGEKPTGEASAEPKGDAGEVRDTHGQPGINKERHDKEVAELNAEIAKLKAEAKDAAENRAKREEFEKKAADLEAKMADAETTHRLELAGCRSVKAAKALLDDYDGDVSKLKAEHPYLFEDAKGGSGSTGLKPGSAPSGPAKTIREGLKSRKE